MPILSYSDTSASRVIGVHEANGRCPAVSTADAGAYAAWAGS